MSRMAYLRDPITHLVSQSGIHILNNRHADEQRGSASHDRIFRILCWMLMQEVIEQCRVDAKEGKF